MALDWSHVHILVGRSDVPVISLEVLAKGEHYISAGVVGNCPVATVSHFLADSESS